MGEGVIGGGDLGTVDSSVESTPVENQVSQTQENITPEQQVDPARKAADLEVALRQEREERQRQEKYNQFLREAAYAKQTPASNDPYEAIKHLKPDDVPFVEDVSKIVEAEIQKARIAERQERELDEIKTIGEKRKSEDPSFEQNMRYAFEILEVDPVLTRLFEREPSATRKIQFLEDLSRRHPLYREPQKSGGSLETLDRIKNNAGIPNTLTGVQSLGQTRKSFKDMSPEEYRAFFKDVVKNY